MGPMTAVLLGLMLKVDPKLEVACLKHGRYVTLAGASKSSTYRRSTTCTGPKKSTTANLLALLGNIASNVAKQLGESPYIFQASTKWKTSATL